MRNRMVPGVLILALLLLAGGLAAASVDTTNPETGCPWTLFDVSGAGEPSRCEAEHALSSIRTLCSSPMWCRDHTATLDACEACSDTCYYRTTSRHVLRLQMMGCLSDGNMLTCSAPPPASDPQSPL